MKKIENYMLPAHMNKLYTEEAVSSIALARDTAAKINEIIDALNQFSSDDLTWKQEQNGRINKAVLFMKDNLYNSIREILAVADFYGIMNKSTQQLIIKRSEDLQKQINALNNGSPIPVASVAEMKDTTRIYVNTSNGKWYYHNGSSWIPVATYQATGIGDNEITSEKRTPVGDYGYLLSEKGDITIDIDNLTISVNATHMLIFRNRIITVEPKTFDIPSQQPYMLYFDVVERDFRFHRPSDDVYQANENCVYLGYIAVADGAYTHLNCPKYTVIFGGKKIGYVNGTNMKPVRAADLLSGKVSIDTENKQIIFSSAVYSLGFRYVTISSTISYEEESAARIKYVVYDQTENAVKVYENRNSENIDEILLFAFYAGKLYHSYVNRHLYTINGIAEGNPTDKLYGKTAAFIGDSITRGAGSSTPFTDYLMQETSLTVSNFGVDGSCIADKASETAQSFIDRLADYQSADIIGVMGGTNDFWNNVPMGTIDDSDTTTFYGALNTIAQHIITTFPGAYFFFMTPIMGYRSAARVEAGAAAFPYPTNSQDLTLDDYCEAIRNVAEKYSVPLLDMKRVSGMCPLIESEDNRLYSDGVHPNATGYQQIAKTIGRFLTANYRG